MSDGDADKAVLDLEQFPAEPQSVKVELIRRSLANIGSGEKNLTQGHYEGILQLAEQNVTGRKMELPGGFAVRREYENLIFFNCRVGPAPPKGVGRMGNSFAHAALGTAWAGGPAHPTTVEIPGQTRFGGYLIEASISDADETYEKSQIANRKSQIPASSGAEWFDLEKIKQPLVVRLRRPGDKFVPLGQNKAMKLGKFLTAQRVPYGIRSDVLVVVDSEKIIWVCPVRISEQSKITGQTRKILQLQITNLNA
jgi:tRNA(Ile)-lysidine synthase